MDAFILAGYNARDAVLLFMERGGPILTWMALLLVVMWGMVFEHLWYFLRHHRKYEVSVMDQWTARTEHTSWYANKLRDTLIAKGRMVITRQFKLIESCVLLCPLLGLLGTVTGMIDVFHVLGVTGGGDAKAMAGGVSRATLPTLAGMVAALSGVAATTMLQSLIRSRQLRLEHSLGTMGETHEYERYHHPEHIL